MFGSLFPRLVLSATGVSAACLLATAPAQFARAQDFSRPAQSPGTNMDSSDYGAGGHMNATVNQATGELTGQVFDPHNTLRREVKETYSIDGGTKYESERVVYDFGLKGNLLDKCDYKFDLKGGLSYLDNEHFGLHGERTWEQKTTYKPDGYDTSTWHFGLDYKHAWSDETTTYKPPPTAPGKPATLNAQPLQAPPPSLLQVGVLFPSDFHAGETVTGSLWPGTYAEGFKTVPGLSEFSFPIEVAHLPDGTPSWSSLEIGVKDDGYSTVNPNGTFSLHIPSTWTGPLQLQTRDFYSLPGAGPSNALLDIGNPVAAPTLPSNLVSLKVTGIVKADNLKYLKHLWNLAYDLENDFNAAQDIKDDEFYWATMGDLEEYEYYLWEEIDSVIETLPPGDVAQLANDQIKMADEDIKTLEDGPQTAENVADLKDLNGWADFLDDEAAHAHWLAGDRVSLEATPYWTNPILTQGKLAALRGEFYNDPLDTNLHIGNNTIWPLAGTGSELYFMPPINLMPGFNNLILDGPGMPPTEMPVFYMTLTMWADALSLRKGQSTTYHVKLDGLNGLSASAWSSSFFPSDLVSPSELSGGTGASSAPGGSQSGYITLAVTNESPGTITMANTFTTLDAKLFAPSGSYQISGGVGAIADGGFSILGVARAYLQPELGFGYPLGSTPPATSGFGDSIWNPSTHLDYNPASTTGLYSLASCPSSLDDTPCSSGTLPPNAATVGDTAPVQSTTPAPTDAATIRAAAAKALNDAQQAEQKADKDLTDAKKEADDAFQDAAKDVPKDLMDAYEHAWENMAQARGNLRKTTAAARSNSSPETKLALEQAQAANEQSDKLMEDAHEAVIAKFKFNKWQKWQAADIKWQKATAASIKATGETRAAMEVAEAVGVGYRPPDAPSPPPPPPPPPPQ